jgi:hypothetical protein
VCERRNGGGRSAAASESGRGPGREGNGSGRSAHAQSLIFAPSTMDKLPRRKQRAVGWMTVANTRKEGVAETRRRQLMSHMEVAVVA